MLVLLHAPELIRILMTASSATARFLSLAVLVLSLAPLASLYFMFFTMLGMEPTSFIMIDGELPKNMAESAVGKLLGGESIDWAQLAQNSTAVEEIFNLMYQEAYRHQSPLMMTWGGTSSFSAELAQQHWSIVVPWLLTFILGVVVPLILSCWSFFRQGQRRRRANSQQRYKKVLKKIAKYSKSLTVEDQVGEGSNSSSWSPLWIRADREKADAPQAPMATASEDTNSSTDCDDDSVTPISSTVEKEDHAKHWWLPRPGQTCQDVPQVRRCVPGTCVICLNPYQLRETVAWSSNPSCVHCFHQECISKWLTRQIECPCCRQGFLHKQKRLA